MLNNIHTQTDWIEAVTEAAEENDQMAFDELDSLLDGWLMNEGERFVLKRMLNTFREMAENAS